MAHLSSTRIAYTTSLILLFSVLLVVLNFPDFIFSQAWIPLVSIGSVIVLMIAARKNGRHLMRNEGYDSIWEFRWFFLGFWIIMLIASIVITVVRQSSSEFAWTILVAIITALNVSGLIIHWKNRKNLVKNIKKEELFQ